jgi:hypothetical protein
VKGANNKMKKANEKPAMTMRENNIVQELVEVLKKYELGSAQAQFILDLTKESLNKQEAI